MTYKVLEEKVNEGTIQNELNVDKYIRNYEYLSMSIKKSIIDLISKINLLENKLFKITTIKNDNNELVPVVIGQGGKNYILESPHPSHIPDIYLRFPFPPSVNSTTFPDSCIKTVLNSATKSNKWRVCKFSKDTGNSKIHGVLMIKRASGDIQQILLGEGIFINLLNNVKGYDKREEIFKILKEAQFPFMSSLPELVFGSQAQHLPSVIVSGDPISGISSIGFERKTEEAQARAQLLGIRPYNYRYSPFAPSVPIPEKSQFMEQTRTILGTVVPQLGIPFVFPETGQNLADYAYERALNVRLFPALQMASEFDVPTFSKRLSIMFGGDPSNYTNFSKYLGFIAYTLPFLPQDSFLSSSGIQLFSSMFPDSITFVSGSIISAYRRDPNISPSDLSRVFNAVKNLSDQYGFGAFLPVEFGAVFKLGVQNGYLGDIKEISVEEYTDRLKEYIIPMSAAKHIVRNIYLIKDGDPLKYFKLMEAFRTAYPFQKGEELARTMFFHAYYHKFGGFEDAVLFKIGDKFEPGEISREKFKEDFAKVVANARHSNIGNMYGMVLRLKADGFIKPGTPAYNLAESIIKGEVVPIYPLQVFEILMKSGVNMSAIQLYMMNREMNALALPIQAVPSILQATYRNYMLRANVLLHSRFVGRGLNQKQRELLVRQILDIQAQRLGYTNFKEVEQLMGPRTIEAIHELNHEADYYATEALKALPHSNVYSGIAGIIRALVTKGTLTDVFMRFFGGIRTSDLPSIDVSQMSENPSSFIDYLNKTHRLHSSGQVFGVVGQ